MTDPTSILITADELARRLADERARPATRPAGPRTVVLDVRWSLAVPDGRPAFQAGHVPGAVYVDLDHELADHEVQGRGRHPLPSEAAFTEAMRSWGLRDGDTAVVMDDLGNQSAARAWWLLRHAGFADVRLRVEVILGRGSMTLRTCLGLQRGSVVRLTQSAGQDLFVLVNDVPVARGEVVIIDDSVSLRLTEFRQKSATEALA